jgi:hypothetical protein
MIDIDKELRKQFEIEKKSILKENYSYIKTKTSCGWKSEYDEFYDKAYTEWLESKVYKKTKIIKQLENKINGNHCGYGSLQEQGYWQGCEHAESHYKPIIEKLKKENSEKKQIIKDIHKAVEDIETYFVDELMEVTISKDELLQTIENKIKGVKE